MPDQPTDRTDHPYLVSLRQLIVDYFSDDELRTLCFDLRLNYDALPAMGTHGKAREVILALGKQSRLPELVAYVRKVRPNLTVDDLPPSITADSLAALAAESASSGVTQTASGSYIAQAASGGTATVNVFLQSPAPVAVPPPSLSEHKFNLLVARRNQVRESLALFERAAFRPSDGKNAGDPTAAFNSIQATRIALQQRGASLIDDQHLADQFRNVIELLWTLEQNMAAKYPAVVRLAADWRDKPSGTSERIEKIRRELGANQYDESGMFIRSEAQSVDSAVRQLRTQLQEMNAKLDASS